MFPRGGWPNNPQNSLTFMLLLRSPGMEQKDGHEGCYMKEVRWRAVSSLLTPWHTVPMRRAVAWSARRPIVTCTDPTAAAITPIQWGREVGIVIKHFSFHTCVFKGVRATMPCFLIYKSTLERKNRQSSPGMTLSMLLCTQKVQLRPRQGGWHFTERRRLAVLLLRWQNWLGIRLAEENGWLPRASQGRGVGEQTSTSHNPYMKRRWENWWYAACHVIEMLPIFIITDKKYACFYPCYNFSTWFFIVRYNSLLFLIEQFIYVLQFQQVPAHLQLLQQIGLWYTWLKKITRHLLKWEDLGTFLKV